MTIMLAGDNGDGPADQPVEPSSKEKRQDRRRRTLKEARVILNEWSTIDCVIRDISSRGALLRFGGPTTLPPSFRLLISQDRTVMPVDLLWQRGLSAGVSISGPSEPAPHR